MARNSAATLDRGASPVLAGEEEVDERIPVGTIVAERYRVKSTLGAGGMGTVYLGEHLTVGRGVAIKVLNGEWSGQRFVARRFEAEARIASAIGHPNIVEVFDAGTLPDGRLFLVMEHLEGHDLAAEILRRGTLSPTRTASILRQVALALAAAHRVGVIHRDLKPGNVMIARRADDEIVKILDFGIACSPRSTARDGQRLTLPGSVMGTPDYMAPEQCTSAEPTPRFDIYALGVMAYEMLTGQPPIVADDVHELLVRKRQEPSPSLALRAPQVPPELVRLIDDCLQIQPSHRPLDASEFLDRLDLVIAGLPADEPAAASLGAGSRRPGNTARLALDADSDPDFFAPRRALPGPPTIPALAKPTQPASRARLGLLALGALGLGLVALLLSQSDRSAQPFAELAPQQDTPTAPPALPARPIEAAAPAQVPAPIVPPATPPDPPPPTPAIATPRPAASKPVSGKRAYDSSECTRQRTRADEARRAQSWGLLRDLSRKRDCWASDAEARKLQTKALMELGDFTGCIAAGQGLTDTEVVKWRKLCQARGG